MDHHPSSVHTGDVFMWTNDLFMTTPGSRLRATAGSSPRHANGQQGCLLQSPGVKASTLLVTRFPPSGPVTPTIWMAAGEHDVDCLTKAKAAYSC